MVCSPAGPTPRRRARLLPLLVLAMAAVPAAAPDQRTSTPKWMAGPFVRADAANPCLSPGADRVFSCPVRQATVRWEEANVLNPAAVVRDGRVFLLYRAQDLSGGKAGTSRVGLAWSEDGLRFERAPEPVLYPADDAMKAYEWPGGCEDPRIVESAEGTYFMTYTAYDGKTARLAVASSRDLRAWTKHGLAFEHAHAGKYRDTWSKSGAVVSRRVGSRIVAERIRGRYWMYWGDTDIFLATSTDLIDWAPLEDPGGTLVRALRPRRGAFDSELVEPGPPPLAGDLGIVLLYNSRNRAVGGDRSLPAGAYAAGQALFALDDPARLVTRASRDFLRPERDYERAGEVNNVCFVEGLVPFGDRWFLYYGTADSKIAVAVAPAARP